MNSNNVSICNEKGVKPHLEGIKELLNHLYHENIILHVGKFSIFGLPLDAIQSDGFCNRTPDTFALTDGKKVIESYGNQLIWEAVQVKLRCAVPILRQ